jgi:anti-anti-sigma regulatory factor
MSPPAHAAALPIPSAAPIAVSAFSGEVVSLAGVAALDAAVLSSLVRTHGKVARSGRKVRVVHAAPEVARTLRVLGLAWMLEGRPLPNLAPANEPMTTTRAA